MASRILTEPHGSRNLSQTLVISCNVMESYVIFPNPVEMVEGVEDTESHWAPCNMSDSQGTSWNLIEVSEIMEFNRMSQDASHASLGMSCKSRNVTGCQEFSEIYWNLTESQCHGNSWNVT